MRLIQVLSFAILAVAIAGNAWGQVSSTPQFFAVDPRASFYRANDDAVAPPTMIFLGSIAGATLRITPSGGFQAAGGPVSPPLFSAIFSATNVILSDLSLLNRVPDAIDAGAPFYQNLIITGPTLNGGLSTDIPEDFTIPNGQLGTGLNIVVPEGASWLFVDMMDNFYADNTTPDQSTFGVNIAIESPPPTTTPEPSAILLMLTGFIGFAGFRWTRRQERVTS